MTTIHINSAEMGMPQMMGMPNSKHPMMKLLISVVCMCVRSVCARHR